MTYGLFISLGMIFATYKINMKQQTNKGENTMADTHTHIKYNGKTYPVRFVSAYRGEHDYMVYDKDNDRDVRIHWKDGVWSTFYESNADLINVVKEFIRHQDALSIKWFEEREFDLPDELINNPKLA